MDIDYTIAKYKEKSEFYKGTTNVAYGLELEQVAEWLEELKAIKSDGFTDHLLNMGYTKGYLAAIDDFVDKLYQDYVYDSICRDDISFYNFGNKIKSIAKQMKKE